MPIAIAAGGAMGNVLPFALSPRFKSDAVSCINELEYADLWGQPGPPVTNTPTMRLDLQGYTGAGQMNLQVQVNGIQGNSTVAAVLVDDTARAVPPPSPRSLPQQTEIARKIKGALFASLFSFENQDPVIWNVTGAPSN